jgi:hypothetical protein
MIVLIIEVGTASATSLVTLLRRHTAGFLEEQE